MLIGNGFCKKSGCGDNQQRQQENSNNNQMMSSFICSGSFFPFTIPNNQRRQQQQQHVGSFASSFDDDNDFDGTLFGKQSKSKFLFTKKMLFLRLSFFRLFSLCAAAFPFFTFFCFGKTKANINHIPKPT